MFPFPDAVKFTLILHKFLISLLFPFRKRGPNILNNLTRSGPPIVFGLLFLLNGLNEGLDLWPKLKIINIIEESLQSRRFDLNGLVGGGI